MTEISIRRATASDMSAICNLLEQVLTVHHNGRPDVFKPNCRKYTDNELKSIISDDKTPIFVAENATRVVGYAFCVIKLTEGDNILCDMKTLYIDDLCVDENERGASIGKMLYTYVKEYAKSIGCYNLTLNVWECNPGAKRFYEKMGLVPQKTVMEAIL
ncbi:MAG: GNAT family N-acetyltransferase [Clostridia bacterium]|nr:GNAT family N-acetyltransferase [Clostridia bacterium]